MSERAIRIVVAGVITAGIALLVVAFVLVDDAGDTDVTVTNNPAIEALLPARGDEVLRQAEVSIDLAADQQGRIVALNGRDVSAFSEFNDALSKVFLELPEGLDPDENCVTAEYWPAADPDAVSAITWCFTAA